MFIFFFFVKAKIIKAKNKLNKYNTYIYILKNIKNNYLELIKASFWRRRRRSKKKKKIDDYNSKGLFNFFFLIFFPINYLYFYFLFIFNFILNIKT